MTQILSQIESGDPKAAERLLPLVYDELGNLPATKLADEKPGQTLQATALVHEAYIRLVDQTLPQQWENSRHFFAAAAESMRRILVERARLKRSLKLGGHHKRVDLETAEPIVPPIACDDILGLEAALQKLQRTDARKAELVKLRFFAGLTVAQALRWSLRSRSRFRSSGWKSIQASARTPRQALSASPAWFFPGTDPCRFTSGRIACRIGLRCRCVKMGICRGQSGGLRA